MIENKYYNERETHYYVKESKKNRNNGSIRTITKRKQIYTDVKNVFVAHNGMKYDYKFILEPLMAKLGPVDRIGTVN